MDHCAGLFMLESIVCYVVWLLVVCDIPSMSLNPVLVVWYSQTICLVWHIPHTTSHLLLSISFVLLHACVHRWWSVVSMILLFNAGRMQCLPPVCWGWPSCHCWVPCDQEPPLWVWRCWMHSIALGSPRGPAVHGGVPCEILWIWCEGHWQGLPALTRLACIVFCLSDTFCDLSGHTYILHGRSRHGHLYLSCANLFI